MFFEEKNQGQILIKYENVNRGQNSLDIQFLIFAKGFYSCFVIFLSYLIFNQIKTVD